MAIDNLVRRAAASGEIRVGVEPFDLVRAIGGLAYAGSGSDWEARARQMVDILICGIKRA